MSEGTHTHARSPYVGALGFLIGAFLLLPERTRTTDPVLVANP